MDLTLTENTNIQELVKKTSLEHVAIIMDGNRRWAKSRNLPSAQGHSEGVKSLKRAVKACGAWGIKYLTVYAFSTENWGRKKDEVDFLMFLLAETIKKELNHLHENNVKINIIGDMTELNESLQDILNNAMKHTQANTGLSLQIAINYGSRNEIINAVKQLVDDAKQDKLCSEDINEETLSGYLYTKNVPDPDILIRTGGEQRISNYLLWQIAYSEIYVTQTLWPDFDENSLAEAVEDFSKRNRRFGKD